MAAIPHNHTKGWASLRSQISAFSSVHYVNQSRDNDVSEFVTVHGAPKRRMGLVPANQQALSKTKSKSVDVILEEFQ